MLLTFIDSPLLTLSVVTMIHLIVITILFTIVLITKVIPLNPSIIIYLLLLIYSTISPLGQTSGLWEERKLSPKIKGLDVETNSLNLHCKDDGKQ